MRQTTLKQRKMQKVKIKKNDRKIKDKKYFIKKIDTTTIMM